MAAAGNPSTPTPPTALQKAVVKQILSGDSIVLRGYPKGGPPPEKTVNLAYLQAPKTSKRIPPSDSNPKGSNTPDEPYAWEAREFLRHKLIGKEVSFRTEYQVPFGGQQRECVVIYLGDENILESLVSAGLADVLKRKQNAELPFVQRLTELEEAAVTARVAKHSGQPGLKREILSDPADPQKLVGQTYNGIVEHIISGSTLRIAVEVQKLGFHVLTIMLTGIKAPTQGEEFGAEAKFFTESRLLHRDVKIRIDAVNQSKNTSQGPSFSGSVICNSHNIAEYLVKEGMAKCMDWTLAQALDSNKLRAAESEAKKKKLRLWKDYNVVKTNTEQYIGKVQEIINADALMIENVETKEVKKIFLASVRPPPRPEGEGKVTRALYDVPFMFEAREFLRTRLIGKKVKVVIDYIQPKSESFPEKTCASVFTLDGNINVGEALIAKGLATAVRYRPDDESRSSCYDALRDAEVKAQTKKLGIHGNPEKGIVRIVDISGDAAKAKQFLPFLQRGSSGSKREAVVEHVYSASRIKVFIPKENCCLNLILAGIQSPRANEPYGTESTAFVRRLIQQRNVQVSIDTMDKVGNFIGSLVQDNGKNLALDLLKSGYAMIRDERGSDWKAAEEEAKEKRVNIWKDWKEEEAHQETDADEEADAPNGEANGIDKKDDRRAVVVTQVAEDLSHLFAQFVENGPAFDALMTELREELTSNPPLPGAYTPKKGDVVVAKFSVDGQWYRVRIDKINENKKVEVTYIDYGNKELLPSKDLAPLPDSKYSLASFPEATKKFALAFVTLPDDKEVIDDTRKYFEEQVFSSETLLLRVEYKDTATGLDCITLVDPGSKKDIVLQMVESGLFIINKKDRRRERRLQKVQSDYRTAQENAKKNRLNLWQYGDFTEDDAREFGLGR